MSCCCDEHSTDASHRIFGEGVIGNSPKSDPSVARCCNTLPMEETGQVSTTVSRILVVGT